jgi:SlyX protein
MDEIEKRLADLEFRYSHQEAAIEALSEALLAQQRRLDRQGHEMERLKQLLREAASSPMASESEETPPPHY